MRSLWLRRPVPFAFEALGILLALTGVGAVLTQRFETAAVAIVAALALGSGSVAARKLRVADAKLRALLAPMTDVILMFDRDGRYLEVAPTDPGLLINPPSSLLGRRLCDVLPAAQARDFLAQIVRALDTRSSVQYDYDLQIDGRAVSLSAVITPVDPDHVIWIARDVTVRKAADRAIHDSYERLESRYRSIIENAADIIFSLSLDGRVLSLNPAFEKTTGWSAQEWIGRSFTDLIAPEHRVNAMARFGRALIHGKMPLASGVVLARDGRRVIVEVAMTRQTMNDETIGFYGIGRDVTATRAAAERLAASEERFRLVARATNDALWDWNIATGDVWWSDAFTSLFGHDCNNLEGRFDAWTAFIHPDDRAHVDASLGVALDSGQEIWTDEYRFRRADGTYANVLDRGYIMRDENMKPVRMTGALLDITERKQLEDQLAQTRRVNSLGRVAASIAHEFNNVLMGIQPNLELIRRRGLPEMQLPIDHVVQAVQRGKRVTDEILRFTRPSEPLVDCVDVAHLFASWHAEIRPLLGPGIELDFRQTGSELYMLTDSMQLSQVLTNLAINARDAMPRGGSITVTAELGRSFSSLGFGVVKTPDGYVHISVRDTGVGMTPEQMNHVFEPLFTTKRGGTGLGLAISYHLISRLGGHLFVESEVAKGTTFHLMIPATHPIVSDHRSPLVEDLPVSRVLIVEDEVAVASGLQSLLELEGIFVESVVTGAEAIPAIQRFDPDVVVLDIGLPDCDGADVYAAIATRWPDLPVLFSSGHADAAKLTTFLRRKHVGLLLKPYDFDTFRSALLPLVTATAT